ncbi:hypothetical protein [Changchengzhania lutea]|nr:hypothetical protein [Changchengzhania lutea]
MITSKILGLTGFFLKGRRSRIALASLKLAIMLYAYVKARKMHEKPRIE